MPPGDDPNNEDSIVDCMIPYVIIRWWCKLTLLCVCMYTLARYLASWLAEFKRAETIRCVEL